MSFRTIWITIRGLNYAGQAFREVGKDVDMLIKKQQRLQQQARYMMFTGILMVAMAGMVGAAFLKLAENTSLGALYIDDFSRALEKLAITAGEAIVQNFGWAIEAIIKFIDALAADPLKMNLIVGLGGAGLAILGFMGTVTLVVGIVKNFVATIKILVITWLPALKLKLAALSPLLAGLALAVMAVWAGFAVGIEVGKLLASVIGPELTMAIGTLIAILVPLVAIVWALATGVSISTAGIAAILGIAAMGAGIALAGKLAADAEAAAKKAPKQLGARLITRASSHWLHPGEMVTRPERHVLGGKMGAPSAKNWFDIDVNVSVASMTSEVDVNDVADKVATRIAEKVADKLG